MFVPATIGCPHCGFTMAIAPQHAGQAVSCLQCGGGFVVPMPVGVAPKMASVAPTTFARYQRNETGHDSAALTCALVGIGLSAIGVFCPVLSVPIFGTVNYFMNGHGDGMFVLIAALVSLVAVGLRWYPVLWLTGSAEVTIMAISLTHFVARKPKAEADGMFAELEETMLSAVQIQFGWGVMLVGAAATVIAAALASSRKSRDKTTSIVAAIAVLFIAAAAGYGIRIASE